MKKIIIPILALFVLSGIASAEPFCVVYMSGIGCPHCAKTDPHVLGDYLITYPDFTVIDYEVFQDKENSQMPLLYDQKYKTGAGVPLAVITQSISIAGDTPIIGGLPPLLNTTIGNDCTLLDRRVPFNSLDINNLQSNPKIWRGSRILIKSGSGFVNSSITELLTTTDINSTLSKYQYSDAGSHDVATAGGNVHFSNSVHIGNWIFAWNTNSGTGGGGISPLVYGVIIIIAIIVILIILWKTGIISVKVK